MHKTAFLALILCPFLLTANQNDEVALAERNFYGKRPAKVTSTAVFDAKEELSISNSDEIYEDAIADAQDDDTPSNSDDPYCRSPFHKMHASLRHTEAGGVGYKKGYTTLEGFGIYGNNPNFMPFLDLRAHLFDNGKWAGNVGIGERTLLSSISHLLGIYFYYDVRQENHNLTVNQVSPGIELVGKRMEYRMNGYFPVGNDKSDRYGFRFDKFKGHNIFMRSGQKYAMTGGDAEIGVHITQSTKYDLFAAAGPYYFNADTTSSWGGKTRLLGRYREYLTMEFSYSYDTLFHSRIQGTIGVQIPFGAKLKHKGKSCPQQNDLLFSIPAFAPYRFEIPVVKKISHKQKAINPQTGLPWQVWFVNNTSSSAGTFESPYPTLLQAQNASSPNEMIYVFPGDGTSTGMAAGIVLQDGQALFGSGIKHAIPTTEAQITIPSFSRTAPLITSTGDVVTLANNNQVSGMNIDIPFGQYGILGMNIYNPTLSHNLISSTVLNDGGIKIQAFGNTIVTHNQLVSPTSGAQGIQFILPDLAEASVTISENSISGFTYAINLQPASNPLSSTAESFVTNNVITGFSQRGISMAIGMADATAIVEGNTIYNTVGVGTLGNAGILVEPVTSSSSAGSYFIQRNTIVTTTSSTDMDSITFTSNGTTSFSENIFIEGNTILTGAGSGSTGIRMTPFGTGPNIYCAVLKNNQIQLQSASTHGILISPSGANVVNITHFSGNQAPNVEMIGSVNFVPPGSCP